MSGTSKSKIRYALKLVTNEGRGIWVTNFRHDLPKKGIGRWTREYKSPKMCHRGWHFCRDMYDLVRWVGTCIDSEAWLIEVGGKIHLGSSKGVAGKIRFIMRIEDRRGIPRLPDTTKTVSYYVARARKRGLVR